MFAKLTTLTVLMFAVAAGLLLLRQDRLSRSHVSATLHAEVQQARQRLWRAQAVSASLCPPDKLRQRIETAGLVLEPWTVPPSPGVEQVRVVRRTLDVSRSR
ncbi:MAG: hypothetical protein R3236_06140 [Phycisphaeraceae bacterium]|nr:hypothetical protein [Phycisphaeraceae bacterium]